MDRRGREQPTELRRSISSARWLRTAWPDSLTLCLAGCPHPSHALPLQTARLGLLSSRPTRAMLAPAPSARTVRVEVKPSLASLMSDSDGARSALPSYGQTADDGCQSVTGSRQPKRGEQRVPGCDHAEAKSDATRASTQGGIQRGGTSRREGGRGGGGGGDISQSLGFLTTFLLAILTSPPPWPTVDPHLVLARLARPHPASELSLPRSVACSSSRPRQSSAARKSTILFRSAIADDPRFRVVWSLTAASTPATTAFCAPSSRIKPPCAVLMPVTCLRSTPVRFTSRLAASRQASD